MRNSIIIILSLLSCHLILNANTPWSLSECIEYANTHNIQIKRTELQAEMAKIDASQAYINILPDLNAGVNRRYSFGRQVDPISNEYSENNFYFDNYSVQTNISLFAGLRNYNYIRSRNCASLAAIQGVEKEKVNRSMLIAAAYLDILSQQELVKVATKQREVIELQVKRTSKLVEAGSVAKGDLLEVKAQLANENLQVTNMQNQLQLVRLNLFQLLDLDSIEGFAIISPDSINPNTLSPVSTVNEVYNVALNYLPHIKQSEYLLQSSEKNLLIQKGQRSPVVYATGTLYTGYSSQSKSADGTFSDVAIGYLQNDPNQVVVAPSLNHTNYPYNNQLEDNIAQSVSIGVNIPIFNKWEINSSISKARIQVEDKRYELEQIKQQLYKNIQQAYNDALSASDQYQSATQAADSYHEAFRYTEQKYNAGMVNSVEYTIAKNNLIKAESEQIQAKYAYVFAVKLLGLYQGIPISL